MKKVIAVLGFAVLAVNGVGAQASESLGKELTRVLSPEFIATDALNLIDWKVGDTAQYNVSAMFGLKGSMVKSVTKDEGAALWMHQAIDLSIQKEVVDVLINKADGKILKYIHNGKEEAMPDDKLEIISQDYAEVTVPAGTFQAVHIVGKTKQASKIEIWANPAATVMDGSLKTIITSNFGNITMELLSFKRAP